MESPDQGPFETKTTLIIRPSAASADDGFTEILTRCRGRLVRAATRMIRRLAIDEADLGGEGAVDLAFVNLRQPEFRDSHYALGEDGEFLRRMLLALRSVVLQQKRRSRSVKRGGDGRAGATRVRRQGPDAEDVRAAKGGFRRIEADLDKFVSGQAPIADVVAAKLDFETLVERLPDQSHRMVLIMHDQGFSINEIASNLGIDRKTVTRKLDKAKQLYRNALQRS